MQDHQAVEQLERDSAYNEQIQRSNARGMIAQESFPTLGRWSTMPGRIPADGCIQRLRFQASTIRQWMRSTPHSGFSRLIRRISAESRSQSEDGHRHSEDSSASRRGTRVCASESRSLRLYDDDHIFQQPRMRRYSHTISKRSMFHGLTRVGELPQNYQLLAQDEILGLKPRSLGEPRPDSKQKLDQKRDHRPLPLPYGHARVIPDKVFGRHKGIQKASQQRSSRQGSDVCQAARSTASRQSSRSTM